MEIHVWAHEGNKKRAPLHEGNHLVLDFISPKDGWRRAHLDKFQKERSFSLSRKGETITQAVVARLIGARHRNRQVLIFTVFLV